MANATIDVHDVQPIAKASFATYSANAICNGKPSLAVIIDMAALRVSDVGSAARIEFSTRRASYVASVDADHIALFGEAGVAVAQWACKTLREAIRADRNINPDRISADDYIEALRDTMESVASDALRQMPYADGQRRSRRVRKTAVAEGQLSLLDGLATEPVQQSLFESESEGSSRQQSLFDNLPNLTDNDNREVISNVESTAMVEEVEDGDIRNRPTVSGSATTQVQATHGNQSELAGGNPERRAGGISDDAGAPIPEQVQRPRDLDGGKGARRESADRGYVRALQPDRDIPSDSSRDSADGAARSVASSNSGPAAAWDRIEAIDSQAAATPLARAQDNVSALSVLLDLRTEGRQPTADELRILGSYSGWGGAANAFKDEYRDGEESWARINEKLRHILSEDEYANARSSTLTAFYTPSSVARAMHEALSSIGFGASQKSSSKADRALEPGCGTGNFMGVGDTDGRGYIYDGIEIDPVSAQIASYLHPEDHIVNASIEECYISRDSYDAVVGNVPYSDAIRMDFDGRSVPIHDYFIMQSIECLRPGGVAALLTSRYTMDKRSETTREWIAQRADLIGFVRLPEETFKSQAGTEVVSDVLLFRKRSEFIEKPDRAWIHTATIDAPDGDSIPINAMLLDSPELIVGEPSVELGQHGFTFTVKSGLTDKQIGVKLGEALSDQVRSLGNIHSDMQKRAETPCAAIKPKAAETLYEFFVDGGQLWYGNGDIVEAVSLNPQDSERMIAMVSLRDAMRETMSFERLSADEDAVADKISKLDAEYDAFVERFGHLSDAKNRRLWNRCGTDYSLATLQAAEVKDASGAFVRKGDILSKRVQSPVKTTPDHMDDVHDALTFSLDRTGRVDMDLIKSVTGLDEDDVVDGLGDSVIRDPESGVIVLADDYLSGDVLMKIEVVDGLISAMTTDAVDSRRSEWYVEAGIASAVDSINDYADFSLKKMMNERNGSWGCFVDPMHSTVGVDVDASFDAITGGRYYRHFSLGTSLALASELKPGCRLMKGHGDPSDIWKATAQSLHHAQRASDYPIAIHLLRQFASMSSDVVSDEAFAALLVYSGMIDDRATRAIFKNLLEADIKDGGYFHRLTYDHDPEYREEAFAALDAIVKELRSDRDLLDYALVASVEAVQANNDPYYHYSYAYRIPATAEGLADFRAKRLAFETAHPVDVDASRLSELRKTRSRLEEAAPKRLDPSEISVNLGSPWIPSFVYYDFASEVFNFTEARQLSGSRRSSASYWSISRSDATGTWQVKYGGAPELSPSVIGAYGTPEVSPLALMESAMNGATITVTKPDPNPPADKPGHRIKDPVATAAAYRQREKINEAFKEWAFSTPERADLLAKIYNRRFNNLAPRHFDGSYLSLPGSNTSITLRSHQLDAVARVLQGDEGSLIAHVVGAGKTFACIASVMESRRIGKARKPLVVVPNHLTEQWASDFMVLYPDANILYMTASDMRDQNATRAFWARAAAGDWDAVVVGQSRFDMLHLSVERRIESFDKRLTEIVASIASANEDGNRFGVKQLEAARKRTQSTLRSLREGVSKTDGVSFEGLGFDMLVVDEAHYYKNLAVVGRSVAGMSSSASAKCENLIDICDYLRSQGHGSNIVFATGTPVSNTMSELYNMQRYLAPGLLRSQGVYYFSDWAQNYGQTIQSVEVKPESNGFQIKERFAKFHNLPELMASFHMFADIMTQDDLDLDVPEVKAEVVAVDADERQRQMVSDLADRAELIRGGGVDPSVDNLLKITSEGRALALSPQILDGISRSEAEYGIEGGKLQKCAENIYRIWSETSQEKGTQLVFCDASTPSRDSWNVYDEIRAQIVGMGIPREQVAFIHDFDGNPKRRDALFEQVNAGDVRVLFGSTQKLGTGTNVQERLAAIHDVDCPWRPSDLEQRLGRIQRQGNMYETVYDYRYVTTGTFDSYLYQTVERKQRFISQVFTNKCPARSGDDLDETVLDYATIKAVAAGDPTVRERLLKENRLQELELQRQAYSKQMANTKDDVESRFRPTVENLERTVETLVEDSPTFKVALDRLEADRSAKVPFNIVVAGKSFATNKEAAAAVVNFRNSCRTPGSFDLGSAYGLPLSLSLDRELNAHICVAGKSKVHEFDRPLSLQTIGSETCLRQIERLISSIANGLPSARDRLASAKARLDQAERELSVPWEFEAEYDEIKGYLATTPLPSNAEPDIAGNPSGVGNHAEEEEEDMSAGIYASPANPSPMDIGRRASESCNRRNEDDIASDNWKHRRF